MSRSNTQRTFATGREASQMLGISQTRLRYYADKQKIECIRTPGGARRYNVEQFIRDNAVFLSGQHDRRKSIIYARVSTRKQQRDLENQVEFLRSKFPDFEVITDIGSGVNFNRRGFKRILELAVSGDVKTVAVAYKDRLCRIAFDLVEWVLQRHGCETIVVQDPQVREGPDAEFVDDVISIIHSFSARTYGHRSYRTNGRKEDDDLPTECNEGDA
jgi:putative resolvase